MVGQTHSSRADSSRAPQSTALISCEGLEYHISGIRTPANKKQSAHWIVNLDRAAMLPYQPTIRAHYQNAAPLWLSVALLRAAKNDVGFQFEHPTLRDKLRTDLLSLFKHHPYIAAATTFDGTRDNPAVKHYENGRASTIPIGTSLPSGAYFFVPKQRPDSTDRMYMRDGVAEAIVGCHSLQVCLGFGLGRKGENECTMPILFVEAEKNVPTMFSAPIGDAFNPWIYFGKARYLHGRPVTAPPLEDHQFIPARSV